MMGMSIVDMVNIKEMVAKVGILPSIEGGWKTISFLHGGGEVPQRLGFFEKDNISKSRLIKIRLP